MSYTDNSVHVGKSLVDAIVAVGSDIETLIVFDTQDVTDDLTVPANITLHFTGAGIVNVSSGKILIINGPLIAPLRQIFTGAGLVKFGPNIGTAYPQWFGAVMDGDSANAGADTAGIQAALDAFNPVTLTLYSDVSHAGIVEITGGAWIDDTITIQYASLTLRGQGWGTSGHTPHRSYLRAADDLEGLPMIKITNCWGSGVEKLFLIGNASHKPSAAIEFAEDPDSNRPHGLDFSFLSHVYIGDMGGYNSPVTGKQFTDGIIFTGSFDGDSNSFRHISINGCDNSGVDVTGNHNASDTHWDTLIISGCGTGFKASSFHTGTNWLFALNDVDIEMADAGAELLLRHIGSEGSGRFATLTGQGVRLIVLGGTWQVGDNFTPADSGNDRWIIDAETPFTQYVHLEDFQISGAGSNFKNPVIRIGNSGGGNDSMLRLISTNFTSANIKTEPGTALNFLTYGVTVELIQRKPTGIDLPIYSRNMLTAAYGSEDRDYQSHRNDFVGKFNVFGGPFKVKKALTPVGVSASASVGSGATTYSYKVTALTYDGETLAGSAATCTNGSTLDSTHKNIVTWVQVIGAYAYRIYGRTSGSEQLIVTLAADQYPNTFGWQDDGSVTPSGALPTVNTTGNISAGGFINGGKGADVASASTIIPTGNLFHVTGTTTITSVSGSGITAGTEITIIFDGSLTFTDGSNLKLNGNFSTSADDTIKLVWDGSNWYEISRSAN